VRTSAAHAPGIAEAWRMRGAYRMVLAAQCSPITGQTAASQWIRHADVIDKAHRFFTRAGHTS
jgi:hypothetical protein